MMEGVLISICKHDWGFVWLPMESLDNLLMYMIDQELDGALGKDLEKQAEKVLQNQIEASQVQLKNKIKTE